MLDVMSLFNVAKDFGVNLDLIRKVSEKLTPQQEPAAEQLAEVLDELAKMIGALDDEIVRYLSLYFDSEGSIIKGRAALLGLEVGQSMIRMNEARGHCHKIGNIYEKYLKRWFYEILKGDASQLEWLFDNLKTADSVMLTAMEAITRWLKEEAQSVLDMVDSENRLGANTRIRAARLEVRNARVELTNAMCNLRALQAQFIAASKTI